MYNMSRPMSVSDAARGLGWTSLVIGTAEVVAPRRIESLLGLEHCPKRRRVMRLMGLRELMHGATLLSQKGSPKGKRTALWARVAADAVDSALLAVAATKTRRPARFAAVTAAVFAIGAIDLLCAARGNG
jgi:hypothetical protein